MKQYKVIIIGAGPAGYVCAIRCAQLGMKVACIEGYVSPKGKPALGGTCLNVGCIPSKALLDSSHHFQFATQRAEEHGLKFNNVEIDVPTMQKRKDKVVQILTTGVASLLRKNNVDVFHGTASFVSSTQINIKSADGKTEELQGNNIIIASGSNPIKIPIAEVDNDVVVDSTGALSFHEVPKRLAIIGAGVIGLEMGSVWKRLGSEVVVLEALPEFLASRSTTCKTSVQDAC